MQGGSNEVACWNCGRFNRLDRIFCTTCSRRLQALPAYALLADDFVSAGDKGALDALRGIEPIPRILNRFVAPDTRKLESWLVNNARRIGPPSKLDTVIRSCAEVLGLESLPRGYVAPFAQMNAFTTGTDESPLLVICAPLLGSLGYLEMEVLVSHELAHVKSRHVLYHSLAESLATGAQWVAPQYTTGLLGLSVRMLLLSWYRESEVSADRASLLTVGDWRPFESLMIKLTSGGPSGGEVASLAELLQTHPNYKHRITLAKEFYSSTDYQVVRAKLKTAEASGVLASICRYCGALTTRSEAFCPNCGLSSG